ncbi:hypothetical protein CLU79DRAFT_885794 [Phycomyces nitens]|nr:hypothetical protein CLU79DRAFT_885794 [Phycomyces nitens]
MPNPTPLSNAVKRSGTWDGVNASFHNRPLQPRIHIGGCFNAPMLAGSKAMPHHCRYCRKYGHIHFENEADAASFFYLYRNRAHVLCTKFTDIILRPSREDGVPVSYDISLYQRRLDEDRVGWCTCSIDNTTTTNAASNDTDESVHVPSSGNDAAERRNMALKRLIEELKKELEEENERLERKKTKLRLLKIAYQL